MGRLLPHQSVFISHISVLPRTSTLAAIGVDVRGTICVVMGTDGCGNARQSVSFSLSLRRATGLVEKHIRVCSGSPLSRHTSDKQRMKKCVSFIQRCVRLSGRDK